MTYVFMQNWRKLSHNYHQILFLKNSSVYPIPLSELQDSVLKTILFAFDKCQLNIDFIGKKKNTFIPNFLVVCLVAFLFKTFIVPDVFNN